MQELQQAETLFPAQVVKVDGAACAGLGGQVSSDAWNCRDFGVQRRERRKSRLELQVGGQAGRQADVLQSFPPALAWHRTTPSPPLHSTPLAAQAAPSIAPRHLPHLLVPEAQHNIGNVEELRGDSRRGKA